jgi:NadR type nicotinamide-nucleotide adenylyltransferase
MKKIVIIGPESTGKSTLCTQLATHYKTVWCPEYAREYLIKNGINYTYPDLQKIASGQLQLEDELLKKAQNNLYFIDTDMYVMKVWCEVAFNNCHTSILKQIALRKYDHYFLCDIDLPWVQDGLREYPDIQKRRELAKMYKDILINSNAEWSIISGAPHQRFQIATSIIDSVFAKT